MKCFFISFCISFLIFITANCELLFKAKDGQKIFMPRYDRNGSKIAFFMKEENSSWNIYVYDKENKSLKKTTNEEMNVQLISGLSWDLNDKYIYFVSRSDICESDFLCSFIVKVDSKGNDAKKSLKELKKEKKVIAFEKDSMSTCFGIDICRCLNCIMKENILVSFFNKLIILGKNGKEKSVLIDLKFGNYIFHNVRWSSNCENLVFELWEPTKNKGKIGEEWKFKTSIYQLRLTNSNKEIIDINSKQLKKVAVSSSKNLIYHSPSFTSDGLCILYSREKNEKFDFGQLFENDILCPAGIGCGEVTNVLSYIGDKDRVERDFTEVNKNSSYQLEQCLCKSGKFIYLKRDEEDFYSINEVMIENKSKITSEKGGLVFLNGKLSMVALPGSFEENFKMGIISARQDVFEVENWILKILDNRFIDFSKKEKKPKKKVLLFFHYNDLNNDGYLDSTSPGIREDALALYFYNESDNEWVKGDFRSRFNDNFLIFETTKLYKFGIFVGVRGYFPPIIKVLRIIGIKANRDEKENIVFSASKIISDGDIRVVIEIYDSKNTSIRKLFYPQVDVIIKKKAGRIILGKWDLKGSEGEKVRGGIYKYVLTAQDKLNTTKFQHWGKISIK